MNRRLILLVGAAAALSAPGLVTSAAAQATPAPASAQVQETAQTRARQALPDAVFQELERMGEGMERDGVPAELLFQKALEGLAKRVPANRIVPAVQGYAGRLLQARNAFGSAPPTPLVIAGADALQRGVPNQALQRIGQRPDRSPMAVLVLADLVETGVSTDRALELVGEALQQRTREREMLGIPEQVRRLMRQGRTAQDAAEEIQRAMRRNRGGGVGPPVPPGSEPLTEERMRQRRRGSGGG